MWALIDNYDSFTHILLHYLLQVHSDCKVFKNDAISVQELVSLNPERIILSPGPETPLQAGITLALIAHFHRQKPILGVCLGHQAIGMHYGATLSHAPKPMHGKQSEVQHNNHPLFAGVSNPFTAMRYHSLRIEHLPDALLPIATSNDGVVQAVAHVSDPVVGIQFHPESVGTKDGLRIIENWSRMYPNC